MTRATTPMEERIRRATIVDENGCWRWQLYLMPTEGYGRIAVGDRTLMAHRVSYETFVGPIPDGLHLDHLCRVRDCVNPQHLEPVTCQENILRSPFTEGARNAAKTECAQGHPFDDANTYRYRGLRICRTCAREYRRRLRSNHSNVKVS